MSGKGNIYTKLKAVSSLSEAFENTVAVPTSWVIAVTDIKQSTQAIEQGRYKDVNTAGGLATMALSNEFGSLEFPFIFGGDGATFLVPSELRERVGAILLATARKVKEFFNLELRVAMVPVSLLVEQGHSLRMAKLQISPYYTQAVIVGDGVAVAESWVKNREDFVLQEKDFPEVEPNFNGFTCRWQDVPSLAGETVALIVAVRSTQEKENYEILQKVLRSIEEAYGPETHHHPLQEKNLKPALSTSIVWREAAARAGEKKGLLFALQLVRILFEIFMTNLIMIFKLPIKVYHYQLKDLRRYNVISSDYKKYDGMLKMVIAGSAAARQKLEASLDELQKQGLIFYGMHVSNRALLTCLLHAESVQEVHFVDAADGGYALAAKKLKTAMGV